MTLTFDSALPDELLLQVVDSLSFPQLLVCTHVCRRLRQIAQASDVFWQIVSAHSVSPVHLAMLKRRIAAGLERPFELHLRFSKTVMPEERTLTSALLNKSTVARLTSFTLDADVDTMKHLMQHLRDNPAPLLEDLELGVAIRDGVFLDVELLPDIFASQAPKLQSATLRRIITPEIRSPVFDQLCTLRYELFRGSVPFGMLAHTRKLRTLELLGWDLWLPADMTLINGEFAATLTHLHMSVFSHQYGALSGFPYLNRMPAISFMPEPSAEFARTIVGHLSGSLRISIRNEPRRVCSIKFEEVHTGRWRRIGYAKVSDTSRGRFGNTIRDTYFAGAIFGLADSIINLSLTVKTVWVTEFLPQLPFCTELALLLEHTNDMAKLNLDDIIPIDMPILRTISISSWRAGVSLDTAALALLLARLLSLPLAGAVRPQLWIRQISLNGDTTHLSTDYDLYYAEAL